MRRRFGHGGPTIALNAHGDVVPPGQGWTRDPYGAEIIDDPDHGLGDVWPRRGRAANPTSQPIPGPCWRLIELEKHGDAAAMALVELHFTYDEEVGGNVGPKRLIAQQLSTARSWRSVPASRTRSTSAHNGCLHLEVVVNGKSGHAAMPDTGVDALEAATDILNALYAHREELAQQHSKVRGIETPTLNIGLIQGGINTNVVPDRVTLRIDRRIIPEESAERGGGAAALR